MIQLQEANQLRFAARESERARVRAALRAVLANQLPQGTRVWVYGSLCNSGRFHEVSDIDIAVEDPHDRLRPFALIAAISETTGRAADVCRMEETRLAPAIRRAGELWIL